MVNTLANVLGCWGKPSKKPRQKKKQFLVKNNVKIPSGGVQYLDHFLQPLLPLALGRTCG